MKNFTKIFFAVAALVGAYACTTDATEDLGVKVGDQTTITISLDESRTQLGEKADGLYPVTWSAGDKISINGVESGEAVISSDNPASATFTVSGVTAPYCVAYPVALNGQVVFQPEQTHTEGSFASGVATMYGYSANGGGVALQHLTGVLKIGVTGEAKLSYAQISTVDRLPIAGGYLLDFESGEVTPTESATELIGYSFGEGLQLTSTAQYLHIAVPAGEYNELYVTLYDTDGGVMYATVKADDNKPLAAGKVREFSNAIPYAAEADVLVIRDAASLKAYAEALAATTAEAPLTKEGLFVADVDMSEVTDWVPVDGFASAPLNGNGYAVKGLTKPLFGSVTMDIKGLHLKSVNIEETERTVVGSLACLYSGHLSHCSAEGKFVQNTATYAAAAVGGYKDINIGGLIGRAVNSTVEYCENKVDITLAALSTGEVSYASAIGGVIGGTACVTTTSTDSEGETTETEDLTTVSYFSNLVNRGSITYEATAHKGNMYISGIVGRVIGDYSTIARMRDCSNYGEISSTATSASTNDILLAGITGPATLAEGEVAANLANYADITLAGSFASGRIAGIFSFTTNATLDNCLNEGALTVADNSNLTVAAYLAGIGTALGASSVKNCYNKGAITVGDNTTAKGYVQIGGITNAIGGEGVTIDNCYNEAPLTVGNYTSTKTGNAGRLVVGGITSNFSGGTITNCENTASGKIDLQPVSIGSEGMIGGLIGYLSSASVADFKIKVSDCANRAEVSIAPTTTTAGLYLSGILGQHWANKGDLNTSFTRVNNYGKVTAAGVSYGAEETAYVGGIVAYILAEMDFEDCHNYGDVAFTPTGTIKNIYMGGVIGASQHRCADKNYVRVSNFKDCSNDAKVLLNAGTVATYTRIGGFAGHSGTESASYTTIGTEIDTFVDCVNNGNVEISGNGSYNHIWAGSFIAFLQQGTTFTNCSSSSDAKLTATAGAISGGLYTGWLGHCQQIKENGLDMVTLTNCTNATPTIVTANNFAGVIYHSGLVGSNSQTVSKSGYFKEVKVTNSAVTGDYTLTGSNNNDVLYGGFCRYPFDSKALYTVDNFSHTANLNIDFTTTTSIQIAGFCQYISATMVATNLNLGGKVNVNCNTGTYFGYGGFWANINHNISGDMYAGTHSADLTLTGTVGTNVVVGGFGSQHKNAFIIGDCTNTGNLTFGTKEKPLTVNGTYIRVGGISCGSSTGYDDKGFQHTTGKLINTGDISLEYTTFKSDCAVLVGGIYGFGSGNVDGAESYCNIVAPGATGVGMIMGSSRAAATDTLPAVTATNCKVGGSISIELGTTEDADGNTTTAPIVVEISSENYYNYIYGGTTDWSGVENYDGCSFLSVVPTI